MQTASSVLDKHTTLRLDCVDRLMCHGYIPGMQSEGLVVRFLLDHHKVPSPTTFNTMRERFVSDLAKYAVANGIEIVRFERGESKEDRARPAQDAAKRAGTPGVVFIGKAQERMPGGWGGTRTGGSKAHPHFTWRRKTLYVDHYYLYFFDDEFGPVLLKMVAFAPFPVWIWCNGHEWLKRQLDKRGVGYRALDNGLYDVDDPVLARRLAKSLHAGHILSLYSRLQQAAPSILTPADQALGYRYDFAIRQMEVSSTAVFDQPRNGRAFFESVIRDHLDLGRPEKTRIVFGRAITARTPGTFSTEIITKGVDPAIQIHYKTSKVKAYFKEARALRVETTINNARDFDVRKTLSKENFAALVRIGGEVNSRFLEALGDNAPSPPDVTTLEHVVLPSVDEDGLRAPGLRFGDPRVMALLASLVAFCHLVGGLTNNSLCESMSSLLSTPYSTRQATYDLRRLRRKGFIEREQHHNRYYLTSYGRSAATFLTKVSSRVLVPVLTELEAPMAPEGPLPRPIVAVWRSWERELDTFLVECGLAPPGRTRRARAA